jgi:hypothetical protein
MLGLVAPSAASAASAPAPGVRVVAATSANTTGLEQAYAAGRHLPASAVAGIRPGSLHLASIPSTGVTWAIAGFEPAAKAGAQVRQSFQDGASTGVFSRAQGKSWHLVKVAGALDCGNGLPTAVRQAFGLADPASCQTTPTAARQAASRALASAGTATTLGQSIANIALSQVGVSDTPVVTSFDGVDCDPYSTLVAGFSANSTGCGYNQNFKVENSNEEWCSDFSKWVWMQAGITADMNTVNAGANSFYAWGVDQGETLAPDTGTPEPGDAVVFYSPGAVTESSFADHVGIVSSVNSDGTIDMVNGDFLGDTNISVQYNTDIDLTTWASQVWGSGEQWVLVTPPATPSQAAPTVTIHGPHAAAAGTPVSFKASATEPGGSISEYYWRFGDNRTTNATGADVTHVFPVVGNYTVALTVTSNIGTITVKTFNVDVTAASSAVVSSASDAVWYSPLPVNEYMFVPSSGNALAVDEWDGASWLQLSVPGQLAAGAEPASLGFPDAANNDVVTPHAFFRSSDGTLAETSLAASGWQTQTLAGSPESGSAITAVAVASGPTTSPEVFYFGAGGRLTESSQQASGWSTTALPGPKPQDAGSLVAAATAGATQQADLFYVDAAGALRVTSQNGPKWTSTLIPTPFGVATGDHLSAVAAGNGQAAVFFVDGRGRLAEATSSPHGWVAVELPGAPVAAGSLTATNYLLASGATAPEVYYLTASGAPAVTAWDGTQWQVSTLPDTASAIQGVNAYPAAGQPQQLFVTADGGLTVDTSTAPGSWTSAALPTSPATTVADRVLLYGASPADYQTAVSAAEAAGLPDSQATESYATAWAALLTGNYLVIAVGQAAHSALYYNACGWANPSGADPGSTPFYYILGPTDQLPGADVYVDGVAATASSTPALATDLAYYAVNGALPPGVTSLPAPAPAVRSCTGQAS